MKHDEWVGDGIDSLADVWQETDMEEVFRCGLGEKSGASWQAEERWNTKV